MIRQNQVKTSNIQILIVALTVFIIVYVATVGLLTFVYGYNFDNSTHYEEVMNTSNKTGGIMIEQYVLNVEKQSIVGVAQ